ncbi:hypothetical protein Ancab_024036 [Ancistrocladus abbreviatus]
MLTQPKFKKPEYQSNCNQRRIFVNANSHANREFDSSFRFLLLPTEFERERTSRAKMIVMIDGCMISRFVNDTEAFNKCANDRFQILDADGDGALSLTDLQQRFDWFFALDSEAEDEQDDDCNRNVKVSDSIFKAFDADHSNTIDREEFRPMLMEMMLAVARGIGNTLVNVVVTEDGNSLVVKAYEYELERIEREEEENRRKEDENRNAKMKKERSITRIENGDDGPGSGNSNVNGNMKLKKKRSSKILGLCACSGKYLGDNN